MKLIDLLVKELPKRGGWPKGAEKYCSYNGEAGAYKPGGIEIKKALITGIDTQICDVVYAGQYEAALDAKNDGWIEWGGGECPVPRDTMVDVIFGRGGIMSTNIADRWRWNHSGTDSDIIAYRLHKPQQEEQPEAGEEDMNECIGQAPVAEWNGEGLPPVGCECEYLNSNGEWSTVKVKYSSDQLIVISGATKILGEEQETEIAKDIIIDKPQFRPLRMGPEKKRDAFINAVLDDMRTIPWACDLSLRDEVAVIYDAIAAGKIPGVRLDD